MAATEEGIVVLIHFVHAFFGCFFLKIFFKTTLYPWTWTCDEFSSVSNVGVNAKRSKQRFIYSMYFVLLVDLIISLRLVFKARPPDRTLCIYVFSRYDMCVCVCFGGSFMAVHRSWWNKHDSLSTVRNMTSLHHQQQRRCSEVGRFFSTLIDQILKWFFLVCKWIYIVGGGEKTTLSGKDMYHRPHADSNSCTYWNINPHFR